MFERVV